MIVVDASLVAKWFFAEPGSHAALALIDAHVGELHAPDLLLQEVGGAIVRRINERSIDLGHGQRLLAQWTLDWDDGQFAAHRPTGRLLSQAARLAIQIGHPLADCLYLALALQLDCPLATCDAKFRDKALGHQDRIQLIATPH